MTDPTSFSRPARPAPPAAEPQGSLVVKLAIAWSLVGIPLAWGVWQVFKKSLDLFR